ncbi:hypothetical protein SELMODRAFT_234858 [Selaginella moellendorffii]|uniref:Uncharacterized protein CYCA3-2 n=1 Tax=Selaginella moellendorffii TaxID=88036 RepID=D8SQR4_SELML|nr:cyclin-A3-1 [Selaginella moellendorffii]EFJ13208.1 hypothetical protein SELMODRAFT_234858 [Selaginella moellendorffii]|eukprot:XP_002985630.1 cyclin-A3-1 [Selaginella moellendorffii]
MAENAQRMLTRAAARKSQAESKRAAVSSDAVPPAKKRRPLGILPNSAPGVSAKSRSAVAGKKKAASNAPEEVVLKGVKDIDDSHDNPQMCSVYAPDIFDYIRRSEVRQRYNPDYMQVIQTDINANMRAILVDWLVEVAEEYKLVPDTLYLTVSYVDQYLSANHVTRQTLQLLGVSCMLIASKYEEICAPQVEDFCYITDNTYTREEVLDMERKVLRHLRFDLAVPTTKTFLRRFIRAAQSSYQVPSLQLEFLGNYLAELTLLEYNFLKFSSSLVAASIVFLARITIDSSARPWSTTLQHYSGYRPSQLEACVLAIHGLQTKSSTLPGVREKYKQHKFKCVATLQPPPVLFFQYFDDSTLES